MNDRLLLRWGLAWGAYSLKGLFGGKFGRGHIQTLSLVSNRSIVCLEALIPKRKIVCETAHEVTGTN